MAYVGNSPEKGNFRKADQITCSATATYNLLVGGVAVNPNQNQCIVSLNGVIQSSGTSYTIASSQITFASALTSSDVIDFILILGDTLDVGVPSDDTVDASKITANVITGQSALGATPADTDELLISDAGTLKRVDYSYLKSSVVNRPNVSPLWYNGDMAIAQRGTSFTGITGSGQDGYYVDRMYMYMNNIGTWTFAQESLTSGAAYNAGFSKAYRVDCTTADASPAATDQFWIGMKFEGQDLQLIRKGTSSAQTMTLAFWVKSNKTGTGQVNFRDTDNSRMCSGTYTISSANTWEHKIINIASDSSGVFTNDNAESMQVQWWLDAGSNFTSGTAPTAWEAENSADRCANNLSLADNTANDFAITGVQLEVGEYTSSTLPPFQHESYQENYLRCARYYQVWLAHTSGTGGTGGDGGYNCLGEWNGTSEVRNLFVPLAVPLRASPTVNNPTGVYYDYDTVTSVTSGGTWSVRGNQPFSSDAHMCCILMNITGCSNGADATIGAARPYSTDLTFNSEL